MPKKKCPKCGAALHLYNWRPECPQCGVNLIYYEMESRLEKDADLAEAEHALLQPKFDRGKAAMIGSKAAITRLVFSILPTFALLLPLCRLRYTPLYAASGRSMGAVSLVREIIERVKAGDPLQIQGFSMPPEVTAALLACLGCLILSVLAGLVRIGLIAGSGTRKGRRTMRAADLLLLLLSAAAVGMFLIFAQRAQIALPDVVGSFTLRFGAYVYVALQFVFLLTDSIVLHIGVPVEYKPCFVAGIPAEEYFAQRGQHAVWLEARAR